MSIQTLAKISFQVKHPKESLDTIAQKLKMVPFRIYQVDAPRITPKGSPLKGTYSESYCCLTLDDVTELNSVTEIISNFLDKLSCYRDYFEDLSKTGGTFDLNLFLMTDKSYSFQLEWELMNRLTNLKISFGFEMVGNGSK